jgi:hypothetical protein
VNNSKQFTVAIRGMDENVPKQRLTSDSRLEAGGTPLELKTPSTQELCLRTTRRLHSKLMGPSLIRASVWLLAWGVPVD